MIFVGGSDVGQTLSFLALAVVTVLAIAYWVVYRGKKRGSTTIALDTAFTLSSWIAGITLLFAIIRFGAALVADSVHISTDQVRLDSPADLPCGRHIEGDRTGDGPWLECISGTSARVDVDGVSLGARALLATGELLTTLAILAPIALTAIICFETTRGRTFGRTVIRSLWATAIAILVAGVAGTALTPFGEYLALKDLGPDYAPQSIQTGLSLIAIGGALLCAAFAAIFQHGARLQRDTEGLV